MKQITVGYTLQHTTCKTWTKLEHVYHDVEYKIAPADQQFLKLNTFCLSIYILDWEFENAHMAAICL